MGKIWKYQNYDTVKNYQWMHITSSNGTIKRRKDWIFNTRYQNDFIVIDPNLIQDPVFLYLSDKIRCEYWLESLAP